MSQSPNQNPVLRAWSESQGPHQGWQGSEGNFLQPQRNHWVSYWKDRFEAGSGLLSPRDHNLALGDLQHQ